MEKGNQIYGEESRGEQFPGIDAFRLPINAPGTKNRALCRKTGLARGLSLIEIPGRPLPAYSICRPDNSLLFQVRLPLTTEFNHPSTQEITMTLPCARTLALCLLAGLLAGSTGCKSSVAEANGSGSAENMSGPPTFNATYQVRNPRVCAKVTSPPSTAQATALVQCSAEADTTGSASPAIILATDLQVEIGHPRNYIPGTDNREDIDPSAMVYPIRGQGTRWSCGAVPEYPEGQNCMKWPAGPGGQGACWKTTFGDWQCTMSIGSTNWVARQKGPTTY
jgi:hypothetical protein